jgi:GH25 family lysozyme M1 (1,4-beta-N-acetylmuramidase)
MDNSPRNVKKISKRFIIMLILAVMMIVILSLVAVTIILSVKIKNLEERSTALAAYAAAVPEYSYPEDTEVVTIDDAYLGEISIPAQKSVPRNSYDLDKLTYENGRFQYSVDGIKTGATGIDVSYYNRVYDWEAVAADGIDFVMIRLGYRGYQEGVNKVDEKFEEFYAGASAAGLDVGVYFYTQAISGDEALEEAEFVIENLVGKDITYPVCIDIEITSAEDVRANNVSGTMLNEIMETFAERIKEEGYRPMVYANKRMAYLKLDMRRVCKYDFWYAEHTDGTPPSFAYDFALWQYRTDGEVDGIEGDVDMNIAFRHYSEF